MSFRFPRGNTKKSKKTHIEAYGTRENEQKLVNKYGFENQ